ncbi:MAG: hypothetical protein QM673_12600 [Gordonia sp. (in: high G+C Gram-positive bacteria)]
MRPSALTRHARAVAAAATLVVATALAAPAIAFAAPSATPPKVDARTLESLGAFAPAIIGSVTTLGPDGKVNAQLLDQARTLAATPGLPPQVANTWRAIIDFLGEPGHQQLLHQQNAAKSKSKSASPGDPLIPTGPNAPHIQEFLYPTLGFGCMPGGNSLGRALVTAGPQKAPAPGPKRGQAGYVYTSLGTGPAINNSAHPLEVSWINIDNGRSGLVRLKRNRLINATSGPGTFTGIATTGKGRVISTLYGDVTTKTKGHIISCTIIPTIGLAII